MFAAHTVSLRFKKSVPDWSLNRAVRALLLHSFSLFYCFFNDVYLLLEGALQVRRPSFRLVSELPENT